MTNLPENQQSTEKEIYNFREDGIQIKYNFLNEDQVNALREECQHLFSKSQLYGLGYGVRLSNYVSEIPYPTAQINSVNMLEVAVDIAKEFEKLGFENYKLAHVALYHEQNNPKELIWHSDMRNGGLIRAQIVILGGDLTSGAFRYYTGSQKIASPDVYYPDQEYMDNHKDNLVTCNKKNGSLFLINTLGYHSKCVCMDTRISFMFDFLPANYILENPNDVSSEVHLTSSKLSAKVVENISLFQSGVLPGTKSPNTPDAYKFNKIMAGANKNDIKELVKYALSKSLKKLRK